MRVDAQVVVVTRATEALGAASIAAFLREGAARVYAAGTGGRDWNDDRVVPVPFDARQPGDVGRLLRAASDVTVLVNGPAPAPRPVPIAAMTDEALTTMFSESALRTVRLARAFAPVLSRSDPGVFVVVHFVQAWISANGAYAPGQAALWSLTNALRVELRHLGIHVLGVVLGLAMRETTGNPVQPRTDLSTVAGMTMDAITGRENEVLVDDYCRAVKSRLAGPVALMYPELR